MTRGCAVFLDHGVDVEHFRRRGDPEPADLAGVPHPRIGFFGGIDDYVVDLDLIEHLSRSLPDVSVVLIGDATCSMSRFEGLKNVHWLGFRPYEQIPAYGSGFDVALMPWLRNDWIEHSNPIKLKEYLALGLPIVSTRFPEAEYYADVMDIASDYDQFVEMVRAALEGRGRGSVEARQMRVAQATWDKQAALLQDIGETI